MQASLAVSPHIEKLPPLSDEISFSPKISVGINCRQMMSGNIGSANLRGLDYTGIGDTVNTAQRLQSVAKEGQILLSEACFIKIQNSFNCKKIGEEVLKNKKGSTVVYEVID